LTHSFPPRYEGIGNYCYYLSKYLTQRGHQVEVLTSRLYRSSSVKENRDGITIHRCPYFGVVGTNRLSFMLNKILRTDADLIHAHSYIFLTSNQVALAKKFKRFPFLLHLHGGFDLFTSQYFKTNLMFKIKKWLYDPTIGRWTINSADIIASVSKRDINQAKNQFNINENIFRWVPNAVDINTFRMGSFENNCLNVVFIGKLEYKKGIDLLISVMNHTLSEYDNLVFTIVGKGSLESKIEAVAKKYPKRIKILGQIPHSFIPNILSSATILLMPSYSEGLPTVCLEALASGIPVVASNIGGIPEIIINGKTGYLFPPGNEKICIDNVLKLLENKPLRKRMRQTCRQLIENFYSWEIVVKKLEKIYESMII
jgi:glycosyltransferase involved in cell wall biosynthesis